MWTYLSTIMTKDVHQKQKNKGNKKAGLNMSLEMHSRKPRQPNWEHGEV
jgi:hypothetical protein